MSHIFNYQHVSVAFAIIIRVAIQGYKEYNKLLNYVSNHSTLRCDVEWLLYIEFTYYMNLNYIAMIWNILSKLIQM